MQSQSVWVGDLSPGSYAGYPQGYDLQDVSNKREGKRDGRSRATAQKIEEKKEIDGWEGGKVSQTKRDGEKKAWMETEWFFAVDQFSMWDYRERVYGASPGSRKEQLRRNCKNEEGKTRLYNRLLLLPRELRARDHFLLLSQSFSVLWRKNSVISRCPIVQQGLKRMSLGRVGNAYNNAV